MSSDSSIKSRLRLALRQRVNHPTDFKGYTKTPTENLVDGVSLKQFEDDLQNGSGDELRTKFCAAHSSAALAVNSFAWFKTPERLPLFSLFGKHGARTMSLEKQFPIFSRGTPPNLDVWIESDHENVAIESKLTEYFSKKRPGFSKAYDRLVPPNLAEACWWQVYKEAKSSERQYLDIAQLVKHYFGLRKYQERSATSKPLRFLYLFWEPENWQETSICRTHRSQLEQLENSVKDSSIKFSWMTYSDLWKPWSEAPELAQHTANLKFRYEVAS